jgi:hypothetical protein
MISFIAVFCQCNAAMAGGYDFRTIRSGEILLTVARVES